MAGHGSPPPDDRANHPARKVNPTTGKPYQGHITGDIRDTPEATAAYEALGRRLQELRKPVIRSIDYDNPYPTGVRDARAKDRDWVKDAYKD